MRISLFAILNITVLSACGPREASTEMESTLSWGHLKYSEGGKGWLINVKPTDKVEICTSKGNPSEEAFQLADASIRKWVKPMGRDKAIQVVRCGEGDGTKFKIDLTLNSSKSACAESGVLGWTVVYTGEMHICKSAMKKNTLLTNVTLHEFGHMFGMCDQYSGGIGCDSAHSAAVDNNTIMGNGRSSMTDLIQDDINGILTMADRNEFTNVKKAWDDFLKNGGGAPDGGSTGGGSTGGGSTGGGSTGGGSTGGGSTGGGTTGGGTTGGGSTGGGSTGGQVPTHPSATPVPDIFVMFEKMSKSNPVGYIYIASNHQVTSVALCKGDQTTCMTSGALFEDMRFNAITSEVPGRRFFRTDIKESVGHLSGIYTLVGKDALGANVAARQITLTPATSLLEQ